MLIGLVDWIIGSSTKWVCCTECWLVKIGQSEYINKMGISYRMLILRACPNRQRGSSQTPETTNYTARQPLPQQQSGWSTNLVKQLDCRFGPRIAFLGAPETTNRVARPVSQLEPVLGGVLSSSEAASPGWWPVVRVGHWMGGGSFVLSESESSLSISAL